MAVQEDTQPPAIASDDAITREELQLAARNHGMPLEGLAYDITPLGMHYLLIHFDVPHVTEAAAGAWAVDVGGRVRRPRRIPLAELRQRPSVTVPVTMECAGNGRARLSPRPISQPWLQEAVGTAEWTGTPLAPILEEAGPEDDAVELIFTGADHGIQGGVEHDYERSLTLEEAMREEVILAYEINHQPLTPPHGFPLRLLVPGWYGMTSVKWLTGIRAVSEPFEGFQMDAYKLRDAAEDPGRPVSRIQPRALVIPPGFPDFLVRDRFVEAGPFELRGRAWSGLAPVARVEVSTDGGRTWADTRLGAQPSPYAWVAWSHTWDARPGRHEIACRATDDAGHSQPSEQPWNHHGLANNMVQRVSVVVR
jgi:DMSO/TMAO reductase YedYZ molybdopterin-dependent catalytic subunit